MDSFEKQYTQSKPWSAYLIGTRAYAVMGGHWEKTERGWKWCTGSTFPTPGGDWEFIVEPMAINTQKQRYKAEGDRAVIAEQVEKELNQAKSELSMLAEQMNQLSELALGHREGSFVDIIHAVSRMKLKAQNVEVDNQFREVADAISSLNQLVEDIMSDA